MSVEELAEIVAEYLVNVNEDHANDEGIACIPPTAIPWLAGGIAKRIAERQCQHAKKEQQLQDGIRSKEQGWG